MSSTPQKCELNADIERSCFLSKIKGDSFTLYWGCLVRKSVLDLLFKLVFYGLNLLH